MDRHRAVPETAVRLAGAFDFAAEHVAGDERQDDGMPPDVGVQAVFRDQVKQPGRGRGLPFVSARGADRVRPSRRDMPECIPLHHGTMIRKGVLSGNEYQPSRQRIGLAGVSAAVKCSNRIVQDRPSVPRSDQLTCQDDPHRPCCH